MNTRFVTIISSIALVSVALSSGIIIPSSSTIGGSTSIPTQTTNNTTSDVTTSVIPTTKIPSPSSATHIIPNTTVVRHATTISNSSFITTHSVKNQTSSPKSINPSTTTIKPKSTTPSIVASTKTNNSTKQPAGPRTSVRSGASTTTATPVPDTTTEDTKETTDFPCDCSKYLTTSTASVSKKIVTETTKEISTSRTSINMTSKLATTPSSASTQSPNTTKSPATHSPANTQTPNTTNSPATHSLANTQSLNTTKSPATHSPASTQTPNTTKSPATHSPANAHSPNTNKSPATHSPANAQSPNTTKSPTTHIPANTQSPNTTKSPATHSPANTQTPNTTKSPATHTSANAQSPNTTKSPATHTPPSTQSPNTTKSPATHSPANAQSPNTNKSPATHSPANTQSQNTTKSPATQSPANVTLAPGASPPTETVTASTSSALKATPTPVPSTTTTTHIKRRRLSVVDIEVDKIVSEDSSDLYDDTNHHDNKCVAICNNRTMNETTPVPALTTTEMPTTTTPKPTTTTPRHRSIDLSGKSVVFQLVIVVNDTFTSDMRNESSTVHTNLVKQYRTSLEEYYSRLLPAKHNKIVILGFSNGSIYCNYTLEMDAPINKTDATSTLQKLRELSWNNASLTNLTLDVNKTATEQALLLSNDSVFLPANVCVNNEVLEWDNTGNPICIYKCDTQDYKGKCGDHEECSFTYGGTFRCICKDGYSGNKCETPKPTTTTAKPIKPDAIALSKIDIIGIAAGIGGGLVLILLVALCCVYTKLNKAKKRDRFYGYMDNDKEFLHDENSRIENVPDLKNEYTNLGYQTEQNELQMQRFEPEGKNVEYEPGQRQGAYERDDKAYRQVEEPEGGNVLIYQPKHLNGPMERQSGASKFDEVEERSNPYRMMDTDTTYKIRRPTVNSDRNVPYN